MEGDNEKDYKLFKIILLLVESIVIGVCVIFFIGVNKVNALTFSSHDITSYNTSGNEVNSINCNDVNSNGTCQLTNNTTSNLKGVIINNYTSSSFWNTQAYYMTFNYKVVYKQSASATGLINLGTPAYYFINSNGTKTSVSCETRYTQSVQNVSIGGSGFRFKTFDYATICNWVVPPSTQTKFEIEIPYATNITNIYTIYYYLNDYTFQNKPKEQVTETDKIISSNNKNTEDIINNQNANTDRVIDNQNSNTDRVVDSINNQNKKCENYHITENQLTESGYLNARGEVVNQNNSYHSDYIRISDNTTYTLTTSYGTAGYYYCYYDQLKHLNGCVAMTGTSQTINNTNNVYIRYSATKGSNRTTLFEGQYCYNLIEKQNETNEEIKEAITSDDVDTTGFDDFDVSFNDHGVSGIITAPLNSIRSILNNTCSPIVLPLPFINENITLPCLTPIYHQHFPTILNIWQVVVTGLLGYWICLNIFHMIKGFSDPTDDKIEVVDL